MILTQERIDEIALECWQEIAKHGKGMNPILFANLFLSRIREGQKKPDFYLDPDTGRAEDWQDTGWIPCYVHIPPAAPQLTTPPVLRWEKDITMDNVWELWFYDAVIAVAHNKGWDSMYAGNSKIKNNPEQARRAAEKALGLPIVEEV